VWSEALAGRAARPAAVGLTVLALTGFVAVGGAGVARYLTNYWLYRGFPPPKDPAFVHETGTTARFYVQSPALGGRRQPVDVYLPPGYAADPHRRYPVLYLLHGFPGRPGAFLQTVRAGVVEDILVARHKARPMILAMPYGSTGTFTDEEWADGLRATDQWETFVARDVVRAVDARYRTIPDGAHRALAGLSEGGYGALNIGLHHPGEFRVLESWSGYTQADDVESIFGHDEALLAWNSPARRLDRVASVLRRDHTYVWMYSGTDDRLRFENLRFASQLAAQDVPHRFFLVRGGHNWALWRGEAARALLVASRHLGRG
jgi:enterochelin esterase-like enzyme